MLKEFKRTKLDSISNQMLYVAQAVAKGHDSQFALTYIRAFDNGDIVASDGHRVHIAETAPGTLEPGFYQVIKSTKTCLQVLKASDATRMDFPAYESIIGINQGNFKSLVVKTDPGSTAHNYTNVVRALNADNTLNYTYLEQALNGDVTEIKVSDTPEPVFVYGKGIKAAVMPMKM